MSRVLDHSPSNILDVQYTLSKSAHSSVERPGTNPFTSELVLMPLVKERGSSCTPTIAAHLERFQRVASKQTEETDFSPREGVSVEERPGVVVRDTCSPMSRKAALDSGSGNVMAQSPQYQPNVMISTDLGTGGIASSSSSRNWVMSEDVSGENILQVPSGDTDGELSVSQPSTDAVAAANAKGTASSALPRHPPAGCSRQLGQTILRVLILMKREWVSTVCELIMPIIFIIGSVLLSLIFGTVSGEGAMYYAANRPTSISAMSAAITSSLCYNGPSTASIPGVTACLPGQTYDCPTAPGIPPGLCYTPTAPLLVIQLMAGVSGSTAPILSLDTLIASHWITMGGKVPPNTPFSYGGLLYFAPQSPEVTSLVAYLNTKSTLFPNVYGGTFATEADAVSRVRSQASGDPPSWGIVSLAKYTTGEFDARIMVNASSLPRTASSIVKNYIGGIESENNHLYITSGYATLQTLVYNHYITSVLVQPETKPLAYTPMPTVAYSMRQFLTMASSLVPLMLVLGYLYPVSQLTKRIVLEKELRIREAMLIMGLSESIMYLAWFLVYGIWYIVLSAIAMIILRFSYMPLTNPAYIFFIFLFFSWSTMMLSGVIAAFFSKARLASIIAPICYFLLSIPLFAMPNPSSSAKIGIMVLSPSALATGLSLLLDHEMTGGADSSALVYFRDDPKLIVAYVFLVVDIFVYLVLMMYLDCVIPKDWGATKNPFFFIIDPVRWCFCRRRAPHASGREDGRAKDGVFEEEKSEEEEGAAVRVRGLRKKFRRSGKSFISVNNLFWSLREGEISVLLGHNGAGKSTTINMMTGMLEADSGDCFVFGHSVRHELRAVRQDIGYCPQHNILWPQLTVREHLSYYAGIKGLSGSEKEDAIRRLLVAVDLEDKEHYLSKALSGGQKRKLSVAVAFVGGSRVLFLDEPTAGMDAGARRHTWSLLKEMSKHHAILLTTHFMDEADLLGDKVAIMSAGRLQCSGSNMFLKSKLGVGFVLTMSIGSHTPRGPIEQMVRMFVPEAETVRSGAGEAAYRLPMASKTVFPELLSAVERGISNLGIKAYSLSATTLEEVFIKIAEGQDEDYDASEVAEKEKAIAAEAVWDVEIEKGRWTRRWLQFRAMMVKRFWNALRDRRTQFFQIVCPVVCVLLTMLLSLVQLFNWPTIEVSSDIYGTTVEIPVANCEGVLDLATPFSSRVRMDVWTDTPTVSDFSEKLRVTYNTHPDERYGAISCAAVASTDPYHNIFYNASALHEVAIETHNFFSSYVRRLAGAGGPSFTTVVAPFPRTAQQQQVISSLYSMMMSLMIMVPFTFIPSTFVGWIVKERECKARHLQNVSGLSFYTFWGANSLFDFCSYLITIGLVLACFGIFSRNEYIGSDNIGATMVVFLLYGVSGIFMAYALSFAFDSHSTAQNVVMLVNFIVGFLLVLAIAALSMNDSTRNVANALRWILRVIPSFCIGDSISNLASTDLLRAFQKDLSAWEMGIVGWNCVYMAIEIPFFIGITLFIDHPGRRQRSQRLFHDPDASPEMVENEDEDVTLERRAVLESTERQSDLVRVVNLRKEYANGKVAVRNLTFGVQPGQVFGFLGTNGAGKTTTISILCQEFYPTAGRAYLCGHDIVKQSKEALQCIGYCPQFDACLDLLTVEEHLYLYAGVRGISSKTRDKVVHGLVQLCGLTEYRNVKSHELSGGNRRKLSVAISLIGGPRVVFFDEPSAGMDPIARRGLWNAIQTVADNCSVVLTTHHLEEVEALADRVAIMVDGSLRCIGDKTHLKDKYGKGFEVMVRLEDDTPAAMAALEHFFKEVFPAGVLMEVRAGRFTYELPKTVLLSSVFTEMEKRKVQLRIRDYNVSQTSIEQVFMRISEEAERQQEEEFAQRVENEKKCCCCPCWCGGV